MPRISDEGLATLMRAATLHRDGGDRFLPLEPADVVALISEVQAAREASAEECPGCTRRQAALEATQRAYEEHLREDAERDANASAETHDEARLHLAGLAMVEVMRQAQGRAFANDGAPSRTIAAWVDAALQAATGEPASGFVPMADVVAALRDVNDSAAEGDALVAGRTGAVHHSGTGRSVGMRTAVATVCGALGISPMELTPVQRSDDEPAPTPPGFVPVDKVLRVARNAEAVARDEQRTALDEPAGSFARHRKLSRAEARLDVADDIRAILPPDAVRP